MGAKSDLIKSDIKLLKIVNAIQDLNGAGVTEIADHLNMKKSTVYKHLNTLRDQKYVKTVDGKYQLSFRFLDHGMYVQDQTELISSAKPYIHDLAKRMDELVTLSIKEYDYGVYLYSANGKYDLTGATSHKISQTRFDLHTSSAGKSILAQLSDEEVKEIIQNHGLNAKTAKTVTDEEELFSELDEIRDQGFAINTGERIEKVWGIGSGLYSAEENIYGAVSITGTEAHFSNIDLRSKYVGELQETIDKIKLNIKFNR